MTDKEIIKALECCNEIKVSNCDECPLRDVECSKYDLYKLALDLINRQKAEIERLMPFSVQVEVSKKIEKEIKSEAIKEFEKKFEKKIKDVQFTLGQTWEIQNALKDTSKEMVGE